MPLSTLFDAAVGVKVWVVATLNPGEHEPLGGDSSEGQYPRKGAKHKLIGCPLRHG